MKNPKHVFAKRIMSLGIVVASIALILLLAVPSKDTIYNETYKAYVESLTSGLYGNNPTELGTPTIQATQGDYVYVASNSKCKLRAFNLKGGSGSKLRFYDDSKLVFANNELKVVSSNSQSLTIPLSEVSGFSAEVETSPKLGGQVFKLGSSIENSLVLAMGDEVAGLSPVIAMFYGSSSATEAVRPLVPVFAAKDVAYISAKINSEYLTTLSDLGNQSISYLNSSNQEKQKNLESLLVVSAKAKGMLPSLPDTLKNTLPIFFQAQESLIQNGVTDLDGSYTRATNGAILALVNLYLNSSISASSSDSVSGSAKARTVSTSQNGTSVSFSNSSSSATQSNVSAQTVQGPPAPTTTTATPSLGKKEPSLVIPATARVSATNVQAPCDPSSGSLTHYMSRRECTGANIISIPLGVFSLIYNSVKPADSIFGLTAWKFSFHEYVDVANLFYMTASDSKIALVRTGQELKPSSIAWGDFKFTISGANVLRDDPSTGYRYTYSKIPTTDSKHRLVSIVRSSDNYMVYGVNFNASGVPLSVDYRNRDRELKRVVISRTANNIQINYPSGEEDYKNGDIKTVGSSIEIAKVDDVQIDFVLGSIPGGRQFPIAHSTYVTANIQANNSKSHRFYTYDSLGHITRVETLDFSETNKPIRIGTDITYPKDSNYHYVDKSSPLGKSKNWYKLIGAHVFRVGETTPFGSNSYRYAGAPNFHLLKVWDARRQAWTVDVTEYQPNQSTVQLLDSRITRSKSGNVYTTTVRNKTGSQVLSTQTFTQNADGQYSVINRVGQVESTKTLSKVQGQPNTWQETDVAKVANSTVSNGTTKVSDALVEVRDNISGAVSSTAITGDNYIKTVTAPNQPTYKEEVTNTESTFSKITEWKVSVGGVLESKGKQTATDVAGGKNITSENYSPISSSKSWERSTSTYNTANKESNEKLELMPAQGGN
jgi:hypothetical protein